MSFPLEQFKPNIGGDNKEYESDLSIKLTDNQLKKINQLPDYRNKRDIDQTEEGMKKYELPEETIEKIMDKVQDINDYATAYTFLGKGDNYLEYIFKLGLLGRSWETDKWNREKKYQKNQAYDKWERVDFNKISDTEKKQRWAKALEANVNPDMAGAGHLQGKARVCFNIVGRDKNRSKYSITGENGKIFWYNTEKNRKPEIMRGHYKNYQNSTALIFSLKNFHEDEPHAKDRGGHFKMAEKAYKERSEFGETMADPEYGFELSYRVAPRNFRGLVIESVKIFSEEEAQKIVDNLDEYSGKYKIDREIIHYIRDYQTCGKPDDWRKEIIQMLSHRKYPIDVRLQNERVKNIVKFQKRIFEDKSELFIPVYDGAGNLLWPKKMSYGEIRRLKK